MFVVVTLGFTMHFIMGFLWQDIVPFEQQGLRISNSVPLQHFAEEHSEPFSQG